MNYAKQHRYLFVISFVLAVLIVRFDVLHAALMFLLVGAVPGTSYSISPLIMALGLLALFWFFSLSFTFSFKRGKKSTETPEDQPKIHQLPRRRYAR